MKAKGLQKRRFVWLLVDEHPEDGLRVLEAFRKAQHAQERLERAVARLPYVCQYYAVRKIELR